MKFFSLLKCQNFYIDLSNDYSGLSITRAGSNKQAGRNFHGISKNEQAPISEQGGKFSRNFKNEQALISKQGEIFIKFQ